MVEDDVAAPAGLFLAAEGVVEGGVLAHAHEGGGFFYGEVAGLAAEVGVGGGFDADGVVEEVELVEVHGEDFFLGVVAFELDGDDPFDGFLEESFHDVVGTGRI